jgi:hypothetical protein
MNNIYINKYFKYKKKYIFLKKYIFGAGKEDIRPGASRNEIIVLNYNNKEIIGKKMDSQELEYFKLFQGNGVATIIMEKDINNFTLMEKLRHIDLYDGHPADKFRGIVINETRYILFSISNKNLITNKSKQIREINNKLFLQLLNVIRRINKLGYIWGDLKNNNLGITDDEQLKIFDFGESKKITHQNNFFDLLAFAKLYFNTLVNEDFFEPGKHYNIYSYREYPTIENFKEIINSINTDDDNLKNLLFDIFSLFQLNDDKEFKKKLSEIELDKLYDRFHEYLIQKMK